MTPERARDREILCVARQLFGEWSWPMEPAAVVHTAAVVRIDYEDAERVLRQHAVRDGRQVRPALPDGIIHEIEWNEDNTRWMRRRYPTV